MFKAPAAPRLTGYSSFFADAHWWLFCFLIVALKFVLLGLDPLPQLFMGDSGSYLFTAVSGWIPPDRSFLYGYVIRWSSLGTGSLTSLLILQVFLATRHGNFSCTYLPVYFWTHFWLVLSFWSSLFAGSVAIGMGALRHDGDR